MCKIILNDINAKLNVYITTIHENWGIWHLHHWAVSQRYKVKDIIKKRNWFPFYNISFSNAFENFPAIQSWLGRDILRDKKALQTLIHQWHCCQADDIFILSSRWGSISVREKFEFPHNYKANHASSICYKKWHFKYAESLVITDLWPWWWDRNSKCWWGRSPSLHVEGKFSSRSFLLLCVQIPHLPRAMAVALCPCEDTWQEVSYFILHIKDRRKEKLLLSTS